MAATIQTQRRAGFTLLEVILALAILAGSVAMIGELISFASRSAADSEAETRAQLLATTLMDEMVTKLTEPEEQSREPLDVDDTTPWVYSVSFERTETSSLTSVEIIVEQDLEKQFHPVRYRLVRWIPKQLMTSETDESSDDSNDTDTSEDTEGEDG